MVAADGGVFSFGAPFWASTGNLKLNKPVEGIVPTLTNKGYWLVASDGGVFASATPDSGLDGRHQKLEQSRSSASSATATAT